MVERVNGEENGLCCGGGRISMEVTPAAICEAEVAASALWCRIYMHSYRDLCVYVYNNADYIYVGSMFGEPHI